MNASALKSESMRSLDDRMTRAQLRRMGFNEVRRRVRLMFPRYTRREVNQLSNTMFKEAWSSRDKDGVSKALRSNAEGVGLVARGGNLELVRATSEVEKATIPCGDGPEKTII